MTEILGFTRHPASAVWPDLSEEEYAALRDNIDAQGQDHPILVTADKRVIDGWHRLRACAEIDMRPVTMVCHLDEQQIAQKVIGAHAGRRHMTKLEIARLTVETMEACGMTFAGKGDRQTPGQTAQDEPSAPTISRETVARDANVSEATAKRAISEAKRDRGMLPPKPTRSADPSTDPGETQPEAPDSAPEGASETPEAASDAPEGASDGSEAASGAAPEPPEPEPAGPDTGNPVTEQNQGVTPTPASDGGEPAPGPERLAVVRRVLDELRSGDPAEDVAGLDDDARAEYASIGVALVEFGRAMAAHVSAVIEAEGDAAAETAPASVPAVSTPAGSAGPAHDYSDFPDIPEFLDRTKRPDPSQEAAE